MEAEGSEIAVDVDEARRLLSEMDDIKEGTREEFRDGAWQWLLVWSGVCLGASISAYTPVAGWYWAIGAPIGLVLTVFVGMRVDQRLPVRRKAWPYFAVGAGIAVANTAVSMLLGEEVVVVAVWVVLGLGFAALTALDRMPSASALFIVVSLGTIVAGMWTRDPFGLYPALGLLFAVTLAALAGAIRLRMRT